MSTAACAGLTAVSLFAGIGGFDLALTRAGVRVVAVPCVEWIARRLVAVEMKRFVNPRPTRRDERRIYDRNKRPRLGPGAPTPEAGSLPTNVVRESLRDSVPMSITLPCRISLPQAGDLG